jgi:serine/threonine protein phosphatase PrpC
MEGYEAIEHVGIVFFLAGNTRHETLEKAHKVYRELMYHDAIIPIEGSSLRPTVGYEYSLKYLLYKAFKDHPKYMWCPRMEPTVCCRDDKSRRLVAVSRDRGFLSSIPYLDSTGALVMVCDGFPTKMLSVEEVTEILKLLHPALEEYLGYHIFSRVFRCTVYHNDL